MAVESRECCLSRAMGSSYREGNTGNSKPGHCHELGRACFLGPTDGIWPGVSCCFSLPGHFAPGISLLITSLYGHTRLFLLNVKDPLCGGLEPVISLCQSLSAGIIGKHFHAQSAFLPTGLQSLVTKSSWS